MFKSLSAFVSVLFVSAPAFADGTQYAQYWDFRAFYIPPERHVIEVVQPPYSGNFIINGRRFVGQSPACLRWAAGERIRLVSGDSNGQCVAVFYNYFWHNTCVTSCGGWGW